MSDKIYAILLAAGSSTRFGGGNKLLTLFRGKPLMMHTVDLVCGMGSEFTGIFLIYSDEKTAALVNRTAMANNAAGEQPLPPHIALLHNATPEKGQGESVRLGTEAAHANDDDFLFFFPCDQPFLDADTVHRIISARRKSCIVEPYCKLKQNEFLSNNNSVSSAISAPLREKAGTKSKGGSRVCPGGSPCLFSGVFRDELMSLKEGEAPRVIKVRHSDTLIHAPVVNPLLLADIDDRETLERLMAGA